MILNGRFIVALTCFLVSMTSVQAFAASAESTKNSASVQNAIDSATKAAEAAKMSGGTSTTTSTTTSSTTQPATIPGFFSFGTPTAAEPQEEEVKKKQVYYGNVREDAQTSTGAPPDLNGLMRLPRDPNVKSENGEGLPFDIRRDAIREAAVSYGARGGLAWRTFKIREELQKRSAYLDKIYDFRQFLIPGPSGMTIEPPIITEAMNAMLIESGGQSAAVSDRIYNIINNANIVSAPRNWRSYLERDWGNVEPPPEILRPETEAERLLWQDLVAKGWEEGVKQADEIFQDDLNLLTSDFQGMIRYRTLLAQGMVSQPYALQVDRGVTGNGNEMRVGDRAVQITGKPQLITGTEQWQPANQ